LHRSIWYSFRLFDGTLLQKGSAVVVLVIGELKTTSHVHFRLGEEVALDSIKDLLKQIFIILLNERVVAGDLFEISVDF